MKKPLVILELANNHMGDLRHAFYIISKFYKLTIKYKKIIDFAIKFQFRDLDTFIHKNFKGVNNPQVKRFEDTKFTEKEWKKLIKFSKNKFKVISTAFDEKSVDKVVKYNLDYLKIASCSYNDWPLIEYIGKKIKKKILCSLGGADYKNISQIITFFSNKNKKINYLYCVAKYPTQPNEFNLSFFEHIRKIYGDKILGFSTHEIPNETLSASISYSMGARIFEKHIGVENKKYKLNKYSVDTEEFKNWLESLKETIIRFGSLESRKQILKQENLQLNNFRRGLYLKDNKKIKKGEIVRASDLNIQFPCSQNQISANQFSKFIKFKSKRDILGGSALLKKDFKEIYERKEIENIRDKIRNLILISKTKIPNETRLEISHHYGLKSFYQNGLCMITIFNKKYCKKVLFLFYNQTHPAQFHKKKDETFFILFGKIQIILKFKNKIRKKILKPGDIITIPPKTVHEFKSISKQGSVIEELSTESNSKDSFYLDKKIKLNKDRKSFISLF